MMPTGQTARSRHEAGAVALLTTEGAVRLVLSGPIDQLCAADVDAAVGEAVASGLPVEVDTRHVTFMDTAGVAALQSLTAAFPLRATFVTPTDLVRFLLQVTHLDESVEIAPET
ncbi:STAS domain-containing protein [Georgenia soli]|uniref:STAS domain-containing protein n=1 Tax=Georgenia soli TaxID=638953 RepID=A0A2A9EKE2_9MICO|nr:STAS domain-containing protein [Georgenia soli]PFG39076.1 STAS domain-containing protein [Georgenia soli]